MGQIYGSGNLNNRRGLIPEGDKPKYTKKSGIFLVVLAVINISMEIYMCIRNIKRGESITSCVLFLAIGVAMLIFGIYIIAKNGLGDKDAKNKKQA